MVELNRETVAKYLPCARGEAAPDGIEEAAARIAKPEDVRAIAEQYRVDHVTGDFVEMAEIDQLRALGRLTDQDEAALAAASEDFANAEAYGNTLKAAAFCLTR